MKHSILLLVLLLTTNTVYGFTVDGHAYLDGETDHSGITVAFERTAPDSWNGSTSTNSTGYYTIELDLGVYNITYSKTDYYTDELSDELINSNTTLDNITLLEHVSPINVPALFSTIQEAIDKSSNGDVVLVQSGTYTENINFNGKNITIASLFYTTDDENYISTTIIDGNNSGHVVDFNCNNGSLIGFTITNGNSTFGGGIISGGNTGGNIENLIIHDNHAGQNGGGIYFGYQCNTILKNIVIKNNSSSQWGGGIHCYYSAVPKIINVEIINNSPSGIYCERGHPNLINAVISNNTYRGINCINRSSPSLINCIVSNNGDYGIYNDPSYPGNPIIFNSNCYNNVNGNFSGCGDWVGVNLTTNANGDDCDMYYNIQMDPLFVDVGNDDFHFQSNSPCIGAGDHDTDISDFLTDFDGNYRIRDGIIDMGAYEYQSGGITIQNTIPEDNTELTEFSDAGTELQFTGSHAATIINATKYNSDPGVFGNLPTGIVNISSDRYWNLYSTQGNVGNYDVTFHASPQKYKLSGCEVFYRACYPD